MLKRIGFILFLFLSFCTSAQSTVGEFLCFDNIDNDGDGLTDNDDPDCSCFEFTAVGSSDLTNNPPNGSTSNYCFEITPDQMSQGGAIWLNNFVNLNEEFSFSAEIYAGDNDAGADGFTVAFQRVPAGLNALGINGQELGMGGISPSVYLEIDTFANGSIGDVF